MNLHALPADVIAVRCLGVALCVTALLWWLCRGRCRSFGWGVLPLATVAAWLVSMAYSSSRARELETVLRDYATQGQWQKARRAAHRLQTLDPRRHVESRPIRLIAYDLDERVSSLEREIAQFSPTNSSPEEQLQQAIRLAGVERFAEAIALVQPLAQRSDASNLLGTMCEHQERWTIARDWYQRARSAAGTDSAGDAERVRALMGIGYTERKLGHLREAEAAWLQALELSPTANLHFLVAQFYRDTQQASAAHRHLVRAIELAPERYREAGRTLTDELMISHFGCAAVWSADRK
jgi:tetratricopeptide (TPR) repeat protein